MNPENRLLEGSRELFRRYGIKSVTMDDIARHLGISKKTIYQVYPDKNELVNALVKIELDDHTSKISEIQNSSKNAIEEMMEMMKHMGKEFTGINPNMFYDMQKYHPQAWSEFKKFKESFVSDCVMRNINRGTEAGLYRKDLNPKVLTRLRLEQVEMSFNPSVFPPDKFNIPEVQVVLLDHFLHGISTLKGHKLINKYWSIHEEE